MFKEHDPNRIINFRPLFIAAVGFVLGIYAFEALRNLDVSYTLHIVLSVALLLIVFSLGAYAVIRGLKTPLIFAGFFVLAVIRMAVIPQFDSYNGDCLMTGIVDDIPKPGIVILSDVGINNAQVPCKVKLSVKSDGGCPNVGDRIAFNGSVKLPAARFNSYDERLNLLADGIGLKAECEYWKLLSSDNLPVRQGAISLREFFNERIELIFGKNSSIVSGFLLGEKAKVDKEDLESLRETGTAHLLSLSGFHVGLLTAMLFAVLPKRFPWLRLVITGAFLLMYCAVAAFSASIVRASIMCMCLVLSEVTERRRDALSSLSLALLIILMFSPYKLFSVGFKLSFAATLGIILTASAGSARTKSLLLNRILNAVLVTVGATAATSIISARYFGVFNTYGILANLIAVPVFSIAIVFSFILLIVGIPFPELSGYLAWIPNRLIDGALTVLDSIRSLPSAQIETFTPSVLTGVLMLLLMFSVSGYVLRPLKARMKIGMAVFFLFTTSIIADIIRL